MKFMLQKREMWLKILHNVSARFRKNSDTRSVANETNICIKFSLPYWRSIIKRHFRFISISVSYASKPPKISIYKNIMHITKTIVRMTCGTFSITCSWRFWFLKIVSHFRSYYKFLYINWKSCTDYNSYRNDVNS